jgi:ABC-type uncharacterized transport system involved in gliding motility auxiliary subunit
MQTAALAIVGLIALIVGLLVLVIFPELRFIAWGLIGFGIILVASAGIIDFRRVRGAIASRRGKFSTSTTIMVSVFAGIVIFVNAISVTVNYRFDFTAYSQFTLTQQTKDVLAELETPIKVICFFTPADTYQTQAYTLSMLLQYINYTDNLHIVKIDPDEDPDEARKYSSYFGSSNPSYLYESVVFETDINKYLVSPEAIIYQAEHSFTNAILEVTGIEQKAVYFLTGHGEASITSTINQAAKALEVNLLNVYPLDLQSTQAIPVDCAALIVAGPTKPMSADEKQIIADYLSNNGFVFFMVDPGAPDDITELLTPWGVKIQGSVLIDPSSYSAPNLSNPSVPRSRNIYGFDIVYFPGATVIKPLEKIPDYVEIIPIVWTTSNSWLEQNYDPSETPVFNEGIDEKGSFAIGAWIVPSEIKDSEGNSTGSYNEGPYIAVIGDSDFVTDNHFFNGNNSDLFLTITNTLTSGTDIMYIESKELQTRRLILSPEKAAFLNISSIALLPLIVLIIGIVVWWRRR